MIAVIAVGMLVLAFPIYDQAVPIGPHGDDVEITVSAYHRTYDCTVKSEHTYLPLTRSGFQFDYYRYCQPDDCIRSLVSTIQSDFVLEGTALLREFMTICHNIEYKTDSDAHGRAEYWQLPCETLLLGTGDCEDKAFLFIAMCKAAGYDCVIVEEPNHISAGVKVQCGGATVEHNGEKYLAVDPTEDSFGKISPNVIHVWDDDWGKEQTMFFALIAVIIAFFVYLIKK